MDKKSRLKFILIIVGFVAIMAVITVILLPYINKLSDPEIQESINRWTDSAGVLGFLVILGVQILQVVIAFIPGEPVELLAGVLYGPWLGLVICLIGCVLASLIIFRLSRKFGKKILDKVFVGKNADRWTWLQDSTKIELVTFILFFIPGTPKDLLTYVAGVTSISTAAFIGISTFARIPSIITSTIMGSSVIQGDSTTAIIAFAVTGAIGIIGILTKDKIIAFCKRHSRNV